MKRKLTEDQKAKAEARKARFRELCDKLADMPAEERQALVLKVGSVLNCEGRPLSFANTGLILMQCPHASVVGGFFQWQKQGRSVKKGESGISLWIPTSGSNAKETDSPTPAEAKEASGETGTKAKSKSRFIMGTVFDISQTEIRTAKPEAEPESQAQPTEPRPFYMNVTAEFA